MKSSAGVARRNEQRPQGTPLGNAHRSFGSVALPIYAAPQFILHAAYSKHGENHSILIMNVKIISSH